MLKIKHDTSPVNWWFDIDLLYFIYGFAFLLCSFSYVTILFLTIPSVRPSVSPFVSLLTCEVQLFYFDTFVCSRCPRVLKLHRTYSKFMLGRCAKFGIGGCSIFLETRAVFTWRDSIYIENWLRLRIPHTVKNSSQKVGWYGPIKVSCLLDRSTGRQVDR